MAILVAARLSGMVGVGAAWATLASLPFEAVIIAAMIRAELQPGVKGVAYLRLSGVEFKMAGLLILAGLTRLLVALPTALAIAYVTYTLQQKALAGSVLLLGSAAAALALMRFAPTPVILVDTQRIDLGAALRASRGRYWLLAGLVIGVAALERLLDLVSTLRPLPGLDSWAALVSPVRLAGLVWGSVVSVAALTVIAGAVVTVWRASKQTLD